MQVLHRSFSHEMCKMHATAPVVVVVVVVVERPLGPFPTKRWLTTVCAALN